ncbi:MAG: hypothetical protein DWB56_13205 [Candidatus Jettenia sp.]|uniref:Chemotaxis methyl-accepting receptor HlyB-like 4HB MCP domain-containing protein n=1 Tax=Candidatus Jettenia caeni TaxID=247490 RepID=I3IQ82_9BACT|nr:hypothetical protein [Candidatus Jettenia sp. AMX1]MBC6929895.1 hypothetical protein [Candidatus Jettenia sp.]WKZ15193.1 MAG: hypothetical protein QY317_14960 [Candidatus Jettenia caeni]KAA0248559.1 MAG: hypothetical protein EDM77_12145 [Candidatus Jettenia sp. AMX1]MCE7881786.1 hypothetical protein [Candidatus Jettenia sp. AMX1]MCQ3928174.1 hypothetical protein [Candidatus Jettenia sp.]
MKLTVGKKMSGGFAISFIISAITGGLILYWLTNLTAMSQTVLNVHTPSTIEAERLLRYCGLTIGEVKGFLVSGDEKCIHDLEIAKSEILESYKKLEGLSHDWTLQENKDILKEIGKCLDTFNASAHKVFEKRYNPESDTTRYYFENTITPSYQSVHGHINTLFTILEEIPLTDIIKEALIAGANMKEGIAYSDMAIREFLTKADEKYIRNYEDAVNLYTRGLYTLQEISKELPDNAQASIAGLFNENGQFIDQTRKIFEVKSGNNRSDLIFVNEELSPLIDTIQGHIDQMGINMIKLLEAEIQTVLRLQKLLWFIALIAIGISVATGTFFALFSRKYLILSWPRRLVQSSRV